MVNSVGGGRARIIYCDGKRGGLDVYYIEIEPIGDEESW